MRGENRKGAVKRRGRRPALPAAALPVLATLAVLLTTGPAEAQVGFGDRVPIVLQRRDVPAGPTVPAFKPIRLIYQQTEGELFKKPAGVFVDNETGEILVADSGNNLVTLLTKDGVPIYSIGYNGEVPQPAKAVVDKQRRILVLAGSPRKVKVFSHRGEPLGEFDFPGFDGAAQVIPTALTADTSGKLYIADSTSGQILVYDAEGRLALAFGKRGSGAGTFKTVVAITVDSAGTMYVADAQQKPAIQVFDAQGNYLRGWGEHSGGPQNVSLPAGIGLAPSGHVLVLDTIRQVISIFTPDGKYLSRFGGLGVTPGTMAFPADLAVDAAGRLYVADASNTRLQIFEPANGTVAAAAPAPPDRVAPSYGREDVRKGLDSVMRGLQTPGRKTTGGEENGLQGPKVPAP